MSETVRARALRPFGPLCLIGLQLFVVAALPPRPITRTMVLGIQLVIGVCFLVGLLSAYR